MVKKLVFGSFQHFKTLGKFPEVFGKFSKVSEKFSPWSAMVLKRFHLSKLAM